MALMRTLSVLDSNGFKSKSRAQDRAKSARLYSTTPSPPDEQLNLPAEEEDVHQILERYHQSDPLGALKNLLQEEKPGDQELAWQLYRLLPKGDWPAWMLAQLVAYLGKSPRSVDADHTLAVYDALPSSEKRAITYRAAIGAYVRLGMMGMAVAAQHEASLSVSEANFGTDLLLGRLVHDRQWVMAFRVYDNWKDAAERNDNIAASSENLWNVVNRIHDIVTAAQSLLDFEQSSMGLSANKMASFKEFMLSVLEQTIRQVNESQSREYIELFHRLKHLGLLKQDFFEIAIKSRLADPSTAEFTRGQKIHLALYRMYSMEAKKKKHLDGYKPSVELYNLLFARLSRYEMQSPGKIRHGNQTDVEHVLRDFENFYGLKHPDAPTYLKASMKIQAEKGNLGGVMGKFDKLKKIMDPIPLQYLKPILYTYARRADPAGALTFFGEITSKYNLTPDLRCWTILINAHQRADDLEGVTKRFREMIEAGVTPDKSVLENLLYLHAKQGDLAGVEGILKKGRELSVELLPFTAEYWQIVAHCNNDSIGKAEEIASDMLAVQPRPPRTSKILTKTWNALMNYHSFQIDISAVARLSNQMQEHDMKMNGNTYSSIIRTLCRARQTGKGWEILRTTMPQNNVQVQPLHYTIIMQGFNREGQPAKAMKVFESMRQHNIHPTLSSRTAFMEARANHERAGKELRAMKGLDSSVEQAEKDLSEVYNLFTPKEFAEKRKSYSSFTRLGQALSEAYFAGIITVQAAHRLYDFVEKFFDAALQGDSPHTELFKIPLRLLTALMQATTKLGSDDLVEICWLLARRKAAELVQKQRVLLEASPIDQEGLLAWTSRAQNMNDSVESKLDEAEEELHNPSPYMSYTPYDTESPESPEEAADQSSSDSSKATLSDSNIPPNPQPPENSPDAQMLLHLAQLDAASPQGPVTKAEMIQSRRQLLNAPCRIYLNDLQAREAFTKIYSILPSLTAQGYMFDFYVWNLYVQGILQGNHTLEAFGICEELLMSKWPGWRTDIIPAHWNRSAGFDFIDVKRPQVKMGWELKPQFKTMVMLAASLVKTRAKNKQEMKNGGEKRSFDFCEGKVLSQWAPKTVKAVESMPLIREDPLQKTYLSKL